MIDASRPSSLFELLDRVRARPNMYIGYDQEHRRQQIDGLEFMILGYELALSAHRVDEPGVEFKASSGP